MSRSPTNELTAHAGTPFLGVCRLAQGALTVPSARSVEKPLEGACLDPSRPSGLWRGRGCSSKQQTSPPGLEGTLGPPGLGIAEGGGGHQGDPANLSLTLPTAPGPLETCPGPSGPSSPEISIGNFPQLLQGPGVGEWCRAAANCQSGGSLRAERGGDKICPEAQGGNE